MSEPRGSGAGESVVDFQAHAIELSIKFEGVDVGHSGDVVDDGLKFAVEGGGVDFVLLGHFGE